MINVHQLKWLLPRLTGDPFVRGENLNFKLKCTGNGAIMMDPADRNHNQYK